MTNEVQNSNKKVYTERSRSGFSLVELLITISIIAVLSALGLIVYSAVLQQGRDSKRQSDLRSIQSALEQYMSDQSYYPDSITPGSSLIFGTKTYMNTIPADPIASPNYCYKPLKSTQDCTLVTVDCTNGVTVADWCVKYCLYAKLDSQPAGTDTCESISTYNLKLTPP